MIADIFAATDVTLMAADTRYFRRCQMPRALDSWRCRCRPLFAAFTSRRCRFAVSPRFACLCLDAADTRHAFIDAADAY